MQGDAAKPPVFPHRRPCHPVGLLEEADRHVRSQCGSTVGEAPRLTVLDKLVFPFALPEEDRDLQLAQLLGDDCPGGEQGEENFYRSEDFLVK